MQQGFLAWNGNMFSVRAGRQEMTLGTSRLIAVREGPNIRLAFDGVRASWNREPHRIDVFTFRPVLNKPEAFDDATSKSQSLTGEALTQAGGKSVNFFMTSLAFRW
ncbi:alginate export family protein [Nitrosomonas sp. Is37]|nr:alginate export family protein [Nitrosomonas sp. Is37]MDV6345212.1 alginate export family protein [Nitrosomonas sp. Is37]